MQGVRNREIVVELERVHLVRKRARTTVLFCEQCWRDADFLSLPDAARIFGLGELEFSRFAKNGIAHLRDEFGVNFLCTSSILAYLSSVAQRPPRLAE